MKHDGVCSYWCDRCHSDQRRISLPNWTFSTLTWFFFWLVSFMPSLPGSRPHPATRPQLKGRSVVCLCHNNTICTDPSVLETTCAYVYVCVWVTVKQSNRERQRSRLRVNVHTKACGCDGLDAKSVCVCVWSCSRQHSWLHMRVQTPTGLIPSYWATLKQIHTHTNTHLPPVKCPYTDSSLPLYISHSAKAEELRHLKRTRRTCADSNSQTNTQLRKSFYHITHLACAQLGSQTHTTIAPNTHFQEPLSHLRKSNHSSTRSQAWRELLPPSLSLLFCPTCTHTRAHTHACTLCPAQSSLQPDIWTSAPGQKQTNSRFYVHSVTVCCSYHQSSSDLNFLFGFIYLSFQQERRMRGGKCARKKTGQETFERKDKVRETGTESADLNLSRIELKLFTEITICLLLHLMAA